MTEVTPEVTPLETFYTGKLRFYRVHSYQSGNHIPAIPAKIVVERTDKGDMTGCKLVGARAALQARECGLLLAALERMMLFPVPIFVVRRLGDELIMAGNPYDYTMQELLVQLEDLPFRVDTGVIQSIFKPPSREERNNIVVLPFTATIYSPRLDTKIATILVPVIDGWKLGKCNKDKPELCIEPLRRHHDAVMMLKGSTVSYLITSLNYRNKTLYVGLLPIFS